jgi:hypothetical protein
MSIPIRSLIASVIFLMVLRPNPGLNDRLELLCGALLYLTPIVMFLYWLSTYYLHSMEDKKISLPSYVGIFFLGISVWIIVAGLISFISSTSEISIVNIGEFFRYPVYFLIFSAGYYSALFVDERRFMKWLCWATFASCAVAFIQLFTIPYLYNVVLQMYGSFKLRPLMTTLTNFRVYGTFRNANWFGVFLVIVLPFVLHYYRRASLWKRLFAYGVVVFAIFISGSRSAWIGGSLVGLANVLYLLFTRFRLGGHPVVRYITPLVLLAVISTILIPTQGIKQYRRVDELIAVFTHGSSSGLFPSAQGRLDAWTEYLGVASTRPITGFGPSQEWIGIPENGFIVLFVKYGVLGSLLLVGFLATITVKAYRSKTLLGLSLATSVLAMAYGNVVMDLIDVIQVASIALFIYGFTLGSILEGQMRQSPNTKYLTEGRNTV